MKSLKHLNKYFFKYRTRLLLGILFVGLTNYFGVYSITFVREAIDYAAASTNQLSDEEISRELLFYAGKIIGMALLMGLFMFMMRQTIIVMSRLIEFDLKNEIYKHYQDLDITFYKRNNTGDLMNRISEDVSRVRMYIGPAIMYIVNTVGTFILTIIVMFHVDTKLALYVLLPLPVLSFAVYYVSDIINKKSTIVQEQLSRLSTQVQETFSGIKVLKAFVREEHVQEEFKKESISYKEKMLQVVKTEALFQPFMLLLIGLSTLMTIYIGGMEAIEGNISYGNIAEFILYVNRLTWPVAAIGWVTSLIQRAAASQERINEFLNTSPKIKNLNDEPLEINGDITFNQVHFIYPDSGIKALNGVSFNIKAGKSLAIIGKTGSGKSTIANLICRLYDASQGEILIDGKNIQTINLNDLRNQVGYVPQEAFLFSDSITNNIAFSTLDEKNIPDQRTAIEAAAKDAAVYTNIMELPHKFDTVVGERGITLSGGQKQRVSIARAILKSPQILLFDDCLSAVDTETEEKILTNLKKIMKNKTSIIISHRVSSVKNADYIIVLDEGKIVEEGTHEQLLMKKGTYANMYQMQQLIEKESP